MTWFRFITICWRCAWYRLDLLARPYVPLLLRLFLLPLAIIPARAARGHRLCRALEKSGPIFVKFGQAISTRRDLLPPDIADALAQLQDKVTPFPHPYAVQAIESQLKTTVEKLFAEFNPQPIATASIAQVYAAQLHNGDQVVVKVLRPHIEQQVKRDLVLLLFIARWLSVFIRNRQQLRLVEVVEQYRNAVNKEVDLRIEAANTAQLKRNFPHSIPLYVPKIHWEYCSQKVLVMERIYGVPVDQVDQLRSLGVNLKKLAHRGVETCFTQIFRDNFFHADMHPGNVYVGTQQPEDPHYIALDCAVMGSLSEEEIYYLARNLLAIFEHDYPLVAQLHIESGWVPSDVSPHDFASAIRTACEPIFAKPLGEISFSDTLISLFSTAQQFQMEIQPSLILLQKTLLQIEGLGRQLYPQLDLWDTAYPFLRQWMNERYAPTGMWRRLQNKWPAWWEQIPHLPDKISTAIAQQKVIADTQLAQHQAMLDNEYRQRRRYQILIVGGLVVFAGWLYYQLVL